MTQEKQIKNIYVTSPLTLFNTSNYEYIREITENMFPSCNLTFTEGLYSGAREWLQKWPVLKLEQDALLFFTDSKGYIGKGVYTEIRDMLAMGKPVFFCHTPTDRQYRIESLDASFPVHFDVNEDNWKEYARVEIVG